VRYDPDTGEFTGMPKRLSNIQKIMREKCKTSIPIIIILSTLLK
jgi:hypothetical protein